MIEVRLDTKKLADDLTAAGRRLRGAADGPALRRQTVRALRRAATPAQQEARRAARALPDDPARRATTALRARMARGIGIQVRLTGRTPGVKVRIPRRSLPGQEALPRVTNAGAWRHPVFGDRDVWVTQASRWGWFDRAVRSKAALARQEIRHVLDDLDRQLDE